jgi:hypothetical protein
VFDCLYEKVKFRRGAPEKADERFWGVFALDVQMTASLICTDKYKPSESLHLLLDGQSLQTRSCSLQHTEDRKNHPSPIVGWFLVEDYKPLEFTTGLKLADKTVKASANAQPQQLKLARNVFHDIKRNVYWLQFIDSISVGFPDNEALVTLPSFLFSTADHGYAFVGVSILDGNLLYGPLTCRQLQTATTVCSQTQSLVCPNPSPEKLGKESGHNAEVSVLREYYDRFDVIIRSKKPVKVTWKVASKKTSPREIRLSVGDGPTSKDSITESIGLSMKLSTDVDVNPKPHLLELIDEQNVNAFLFKS